MARHVDELCDLARAELGRPAFETLAADVVPLLDACRWVGRRARHVLRPRRLHGRSPWRPGETHRVVRAPLGRVAVIATWNYPVQLLGIQLLHAVAGGNSVVVKPSERTPRTQERLLELARNAGLPSGRLAWTAAERVAGERLLASERFDHVVFTGSTAVGREVAARLADSLTPSTLELSGADAALVLSDADPAVAARCVFRSVAMNAGRTCMAPRRAIVHRAVYEPFVATLGRAADRRPLEPAIGATEFGGLAALAGEAVRAGGRLVGPLREDRAILVAHCPPDCALARGEHFGPALAVIPAASDAEVLALHATFGQRLATAVFSADVERARGLAPQLGAGLVTVNDCVLPAAHPGVALGGLGPSGWGVTRGEAGLLAMTRPVHVASTARWLRPPDAPPDDATARRLQAFIRWYYGR